MTPRPTGDITMTAERRCVFCRVAMKHRGNFWDCEACGRTVHHDEVVQGDPRNGRGSNVAAYYEVN